MKLYLGVTDNEWYDFLSNKGRDDINFWRPGGNTAFSLLDPNEPFLFKLKAPRNAIGGVGFFSSFTYLPLAMAWEVFGEGNGCSSHFGLQKMIVALRRDVTNLNPTIGCIVLTNPIFFKQQDWIPVPDNWAGSIVQGKSYSTDSMEGKKLWERVELLLQQYLTEESDDALNQLNVEEPQTGYGNPILKKVRLGQGAFRVLVTDAYNRKCAVSEERTLPVLESAHIQPFSESGPHLISNALLLRSDIHKLFDGGYITVTTDLIVEVSRRIKEEFENGKEYYKYHGSNLFNLPNRKQDNPENRFLRWHNENRFKG